MIGMKASEAEHFYEEDEDPQKIFGLFEAGKKRVTAPPRDVRLTSQWLGKVRHEFAVGLRHLANLIEPSPRPH
jgi:hypothetical protein